MINNCLICQKGFITHQIFDADHTKYLNQINKFCSSVFCDYNKKIYTNHPEWHSINPEYILENYDQ